MCCWQRCPGGEVVCLAVAAALNSSENGTRPASHGRLRAGWKQAGEPLGVTAVQTKPRKAQSFERVGGGQKSTEKSTRGCAQPEAAALRPGELGSPPPAARSPGAAVPRLPGTAGCVPRPRGSGCQQGAAAPRCGALTPRSPRAALRYHLSFGAGPGELLRGWGFPPSRGFVTLSDNIKSGCLNIAQCFLKHLSLSLQLRFHSSHAEEEPGSLCLPPSLPCAAHPPPSGDGSAALARPAPATPGQAAPAAVRSSLKGLGRPAARARGAD